MKKIQNVLFLCTSNIHRSKTAEHLAQELFPFVKFKSAGLSKKECVRNDSVLCTKELIFWADMVFVFERMHEKRIYEYLGDVNLNLINLEIEDIYSYYQSELVDLLKVKLIDAIQ